MSEPDQAYEDHIGQQLIEEHSAHPERFASPVSWDRQPDYPEPYPCDGDPLPLPPRIGPLPPAPYGFSGWRHIEPEYSTDRAQRQSVAHAGPVWAWSPVREAWEWSPCLRPGLHQIVAVP